MAGEIGHRCAPKVVPETVSNGVDGQDVLIQRDGWYVIVNEIAVDSVQVAGDGYGADETVDGPRAGRLLRRSKGMMVVVAVVVGIRSAFHGFEECELGERFVREECASQRILQEVVRRKVGDVGLGGGGGCMSEDVTWSWLHSAVREEKNI